MNQFKFCFRIQGTQVQMNLSVKVSISQVFFLSLTTSSSLPFSLPPSLQPSLPPSSLFSRQSEERYLASRLSFKQSDLYILAQRNKHNFRGIIGNCTILGWVYGCKTALEEFTFREKTNLIKGLLRNVVCQEDLHLLENLRS